MTIFVSRDKNRYNFTDTIDESLSHLCKNIRKRIVSCAIELIQNNLIYNTDKEIVVEISENEDFYILHTTRKSDNDTCRMLIAKIKEINATGHETLKKRFTDNLMRDNQQAGTGNGLILCKLKSGNDILAVQAEDMLHINLKFNKIKS